MRSVKISCFVAICVFAQYNGRVSNADRSHHLVDSINHHYNPFHNPKNPNEEEPNENFFNRSGWYLKTQRSRKSLKETDDHNVDISDQRTICEVRQRNGTKPSCSSTYHPGLSFSKSAQRSRKIPSLDSDSPHRNATAYRGGAFADPDCVNVEQNQLQLQKIILTDSYYEVACEASSFMRFLRSDHVSQRMPSWGQTNYIGVDNDVGRNIRRQCENTGKHRHFNPFLLLSQGSLTGQSKFALASSGGFIASINSDFTADFATAFDKHIESKMSSRPQSSTGSNRIQRNRNEISLHVTRGAIPTNHNFDILETNTHQEISLTISPSSLLRLLQQILLANSVFFGRFVFGTMGLVLPLYLGQRALRLCLIVPFQDWYTGRYLRLAYENLEQQYRTAYRHVFPAAIRSFGRLVAHLLALFLVGKIMEWMVGLSHSPCLHILGGGCHWWCALLWMVSVLGTGHSVGAVIAIWGGPLKLEIPYVDNDTTPYFNFHQHFKSSTIGEHDVSGDDRRPSGIGLFRRPVALLHFMLDPDQWFREIVASDRRRKKAAALKTFSPDPFMFPSTWFLLRAAMLLAVSKELYTHDMRIFMKLLLIDQAFSDEWYRVAICEKRIDIAIPIMFGCLVSTFTIFWKIAFKKSITEVSTISTLMILPSLLAAIVSMWMNVLVLLNPSMNSDRGKNDASKNNNEGRLSSERKNKSVPLSGEHSNLNVVSVAAEALYANLLKI